MLAEFALLGDRVQPPDLVEAVGCLVDQAIHRSYRPSARHPAWSRVLLRQARGSNSTIKPDLTTSAFAHRGSNFRFCTTTSRSPEVTSNAQRTRISAFAELALAHLGLAELLLDSYPDERTEAIEHLDVAIPEPREMNMAPWLERALAGRESLKN